MFLSLTYQVFIVVMFSIVHNPAPGLVIPTQAALSPHGVVGDRETLGRRGLMDTFVQTSPELDTPEGSVEVGRDDGVPVALEGDGVLEVDLLPAVESGHLVVVAGSGAGAGHADQLVEVGGGGADHVDGGVVDVVFIQNTLLGALSEHEAEAHEGQFAPVVPGKIRTVGSENFD